MVFCPYNNEKLTALNIAQYFDCVVFSDLWGRESWKPSSKPYLEVMKQLAAKSGVTVYIGDNPLKDFFGARRCGWQTIWLRREEGEYTRCVPPSSSFAPDIIVSSVLELMNYLGEGPNR